MEGSRGRKENFSAAVVGKERISSFPVTLVVEGRLEKRKWVVDEGVKEEG